MSLSIADEYMSHQDKISSKSKILDLNQGYYPKTLNNGSNKNKRNVY